MAEYNGKLSVIDFKTANKERQEDWIENYFLQTTIYGHMYEETFGTIEQIVILIAVKTARHRLSLRTKQITKKNLANLFKTFINILKNLQKDKDTTSK